MALSSEVLSGLSGLGIAAPTRWDEQPRELLGLPVPEPLRQFAAIEWPEGIGFSLDPRAAGPVADEPWLRRVEFAGVWAPDVPIRHADGPAPLVAIATPNDDWAVLRLDDPDPSNPTVYFLLHDDPGQVLGAGVPLGSVLDALCLRASEVVSPRGRAAHPDRIRSLLYEEATRLDDLRPLRRLENLALDGCELPDLGALSAVPTLRRLFATHCRIADWSGLSLLPHLTDLHVSACDLTEFGPLLDHLPALERVTVAGNPLGLAARSDVARLPAPVVSPHPDAIEMEVNEALVELRQYQIYGACARWSDGYLIGLRSPRGCLMWYQVDVDRFRTALKERRHPWDIRTWIEACPMVFDVGWASRWNDLGLRPWLHA
ncbi:hypothetical protein WME76_46935 (plasmid) [Sorangium sp. So ce119]|uniref:hypothetical protein n=1 Tax=Sorangium sp. So ce119 TaxID=3133279 RepID=UPI003F645458